MPPCRHFIAAADEPDDGLKPQRVPLAADEPPRPHGREIALRVDVVTFDRVPGGVQELVPLGLASPATQDPVIGPGRFVE
jgi:hypothetical protein